jgi:trk system potassium uptake protein TrkA
VKKKKVLVICLNEFGAAVVSALWDGGVETVAVDADADAVEAAKDRCDAAFVGDATDFEVLKGLAGDVDTAVVAFGEEFEASVLVVAQLKKLGVKEIVARATTPTRADVLRAVGATRIVQLEREMAVHIAADIATPVSAEVLDLAGDQRVQPWPAGRDLVGKSVDVEGLRKRFSVVVIGWHRPAAGGPEEKPAGKTGAMGTIEPIGAGYVVREGDVLMLVGETAAILRFVKSMQG